jgi:hypothetical protein
VSFSHALLFESRYVVARDCKSLIAPRASPDGSRERTRAPGLEVCTQPRSIRISSLHFIQFSFAFHAFADDFCPGFVFHFLPLPAFNFCPRTAGTKAGFPIEFADSDAR